MFAADDGVGEGAVVLEVLVKHGDVDVGEGFWEFVEEVVDLGLGDDEATLGEVAGFHERSFAAEDDDRVNREVVGEEVSEGGDVGGVLADGVIESVFVLAKAEDLRPEVVFGVAVNGAGVIF